ncbi:MAG: SGNH/GDSL hydrolase family protein [Lachnospiraceae bacterium]|nr:SGNH/GDSL hydrolase family protein [Lachnospiraceae bacterium]MBP5701665.1 SGNH/GDSL hydrolase family protein [Lachnospiraceae bacterium]
MIILGGIAAAILLLVIFIAYMVYRALNPRKIVIPEGRSKYVSEVIHIGRTGYYDTFCDTSAGAVAVYMYDQTVNGITFSEKVGVPYFMANDRFSSFRMMSDYIVDSSEQFPEDEFPRYFILGIDPYAAFLQSCSSKEYFQRNLEFIYKLSEEHPGTAFIVYFPADSALDWINLTEEQKREARLSYITFVRYFRERPNVMMYYISSMEWVLYSDCIRTNGLDSPVDEDIYDHLQSLNITETSLSCLLTYANVNEEMDRIIGLAGEFEQVRASYADMSGKDVFFIGDSVIGNYRDDTSIPAFFRDMTGANVYNLAVGGWSAVSTADPSTSLGCAFDYLMGRSEKEEFIDLFSSSYAYEDYTLAKTKLEENNNEGENSIFIIEFGLNDYFCGLPLDDFRAALTYFAESIKTSYPKAQILFLAPGYINAFDFGNLDTGTDGNSCILQDYRDITYEVAIEQNCQFLSLTEDFVFTQETTPFYLDDVHYIENGRYLLAQGLARYFKK